MQKNSDENQNADSVINLRGSGNRNTVKKCMNQKPADCRVSRRSRNQMIAVNFFAQDENAARLCVRKTASANNRPSSKIIGKIRFSADMEFSFLSQISITSGKTSTKLTASINPAPRARIYLSNFFISFLNTDRKQNQTAENVC